jgi:Domain of unknown function (DUF3854)
MPTTVYRNTNEDTAGQLAHEHHRALVEGSAISPEIVAESGARTIRRGSELPKVFSSRQRRRAPGILFPTTRPNGETSWCFRPDRPIEGKEGHKYEQPPLSRGAGGNALGVLPSQRHMIEDTSIPIILCEGTKKMLSLVTAAREAGTEVLVVCVVGVWNWLHDGGKPIEDIEGLPLQGRKVSVVFDSDVLEKPQVQLAAQRLAAYCEGRGARVYMTFFPAMPDGSKCGADDFFAREPRGTFAELRLLTRRYDPADFERIRLSRDERLRSGIDDLWRRLWNEAWSGMGGASDRDVFVVLIEAAKKHGKVVEDGIRVTMARGPLALEAKVSTRTLHKAIRRLEARGVLYTDNEGRKPDRSGAFVMRANVSHSRTSNASEDNETHSETAMYARDLHLRGLRAPRLRWSQPRYTPKRGLVAGSRKVRQAPKPQSRPAITRLGKVRGSILDALDAAGGTLTLKQIAEILHKKRPRDIRRRNLPMLEDAGIVEVHGDNVSLTVNWLEALQEQRRLGKETDSRVVLTYDDGRELRERVVAVEGIETIARRRYEIKRDAYRDYLDEKRSGAKRKRDRGPSKAGVEAVKHSHDARAAWLAAEAQRKEPSEATPTTYLTPEQSARVDTLVSQGMKEEFAIAEVTRTVSLFDERPKPKREPKPERKMPPKRNGIFVHGPECDCWLCSESEPSEEIDEGKLRAG